MTTPIHTTLRRFTDVVNARGLDKTRLIQAQRRRVEEPQRDRGGDFYTPAVTAVRKGLLAGDIDRQLAELLARCKPGERPHFSQFAAGMRRLIDRLEVVGVVSAPRGPWWHADLEVNVTGLLGVRLASGEQQAWVLHKKESRLDERAADVPLYVTDALLTARSSTLHARVVDVRRAAVYGIRTARERDHLRHLVEAEAEVYISLWRAAA